MLETIIAGGAWMIPLMGMSVLSLGVVFDRWWAFRRNDQVDARALRAQVRELLREDRIDEAMELCAGTPGPVSGALLAGLVALRKHRGMPSLAEPLPVIVGKAMDDFAARAMVAIEQRFGVLTAVGNAAPLVGMLGTVAGMITSFAAMSAGGVESSKVAEGISVALITTAAGLIIALMSVIPYNVFSAKAGALELDMEDARGDLVEFINLGHEAA